MQKMIEVYIIKKYMQRILIMIYLFKNFIFEKFHYFIQIEIEMHKLL